MKLPLLRVGDCRELIRELPDESVHCVVTSPPYWGLRDYALGSDGIGNEPTLEAHTAALVALFEEIRCKLRSDGTLWLNYGDRYNSSQSRGSFGDQAKESRGYEAHGVPQPQLKMHAKNLLGLPWRIAFALQSVGWILRSDIIWAKPNPMPDSVRDRPTCAHEYMFLFSKGQWKTRVIEFADLRGERVHFRLDLGAETPNVGFCDICVRLASAILDCAQREHGLRLFPLDSQIRQQGTTRSNGLFVCDSPVMNGAAVASARLLAADATAKEFVCELDGLGVTLPDAQNLLIGGTSAVPLPPSIDSDGKGTIAVHNPSEICKIDFIHKSIIIQKLEGCRYFYDQDAVREEQVSTAPSGNGFAGSAQIVRDGRGRASRWEPGESNGRNKRTVWTIATQPTPEAHFATFPERLVEPCILAGTSERGCCVECGAPMVREVERGERTGGGISLATCGEHGSSAARAHPCGAPDRDCSGGFPQHSTTTIGFRPSCDCDAEQRPCVVLDPFFGSGTVGRVADRLGRHWIGFEMNPEYAAIARKRTAQPSLFAQPAEVAE